MSDQSSLVTLNKSIPLPLKNSANNLVVSLFSNSSCFLWCTLYPLWLGNEACWELDYGILDRKGRQEWEGQLSMHFGQLFTEMENESQRFCSLCQHWYPAGWWIHCVAHWLRVQALAPECISYLSLLWLDPWQEQLRDFINWWIKGYSPSW